jgi:hypothetical protein
MKPKETIYDRIAAHAVAYARLEAACEPADEMSAKERGQKVTPEALAERDAADSGEIAAFEEFLAYVPNSRLCLIRKVEYLQYALRGRDTLDRDELGTFLHSLRQFRPHED